MKTTRGRQANRGMASTAILTLAERALKNRRTHLLIARKLWQENLARTEAELAQLNEQLARLHGESKSPLTPSNPDVDVQSIESDSIFKLHY